MVSAATVTLQESIDGTGGSSTPFSVMGRYAKLARSLEWLICSTEDELIQGEPYAIHDNCKFLGLRGSTRHSRRRTNPTRCSGNCANGSGLNQVVDGRGCTGPLQASECHHSLRG